MYTLCGFFAAQCGASGSIPSSQASPQCERRNVMLESEGSNNAAVLAVACPGGMARQFRVQARDERLPNMWRLVGSYRTEEVAQAAVERLARAGTTARVVECRTLPTAA